MLHQLNNREQIKVKSKLFNKGFSLIELIVVIAIMAILVAIIAPNLTKYLSKSKRSADKKNADEIASSLQACIMEYESEYGYLISSGGSQLTVTWTNAGKYQSGITEFDDIVNDMITSSTESKEIANSMASATIDLNDYADHDKGYKVLVTVGHASALK